MIKLIKAKMEMKFIKDNNLISRWDMTDSNRIIEESKKRQKKFNYMNPDAYMIRKCLNKGLYLVGNDISVTDYNHIVWFLNILIMGKHYKDRYASIIFFEQFPFYNANTIANYLVSLSNKQLRKLIIDFNKYTHSRGFTINADEYLFDEFFFHRIKDHINNLEREDV